MWHRLIPSTLLSVWASSFVVHLHWTEALWTEVAVIHLVSIAFRGEKNQGSFKKNGNKRVIPASVSHHAILTL